MDIETKERIERLRALEDDCGVSGLDVIDVFVGNELYYKRGDKFRDYLIGLLERSDPDTHIKLPVDADGIPIHIGDEMDCGEHFGIQEVEGFIHGAVAFTVCDTQPARICTCPAHITHHYHRPTVEDVLLELVDVAIGDIADNARKENMSYSDWMRSNGVIAEYASKLRLAEVEG